VAAASKSCILLVTAEAEEPLGREEPQCKGRAEREGIKTGFCRIPRSGLKRDNPSRRPGREGREEEDGKGLRDDTAKGEGGQKFRSFKEELKNIGEGRGGVPMDTEKRKKRDGSEKTERGLRIKPARSDEVAQYEGVGRRQSIREKIAHLRGKMDDEARCLRGLHLSQ